MPTAGLTCAGMKSTPVLRRSAGVTRTDRGPRFVDVDLPAQRFGAQADLLVKMEPQRTQEEKARREVQQLVAAVVADDLGHGFGALGIPLAIDQPALEPLLQDRQLPRPVDDLGVMVDPE